MNINSYVINATATKYGGALTILKEYLAEINKNDSKSKYFVFCGMNLDEFISDNIRVIKIRSNGFGIGGIKRFLWDSVGLFIFCKIIKIKPDLIISFQNTGVFFPKIKQLIYYHQSIPLYKHSWKFYKKDESKLFLYQAIYPFFVRLFINRNTEFVVQQQFIKKLLSEKFHINYNKIHVIVPNVNLNFETQNRKVSLDHSKFHIFYPTNQAKFKNFSILFKAIAEIKKLSPEISRKIMLHITLDMNAQKIKNEIYKLQIINNVNLVGTISYKEVLLYYNSVDLLVFPSYIETYGLPLIEAAYFGLPILASDLDYAHEVLINYNGVTFVQFDKIDKWANAIIELSKTHQKVESFKEKSTLNSWNKLLELTKTLVK